MKDNNNWYLFNYFLELIIHLLLDKGVNFSFNFMSILYNIFL
jgi:hypothetical protein